MDYFEYFGIKPGFQLDLNGLRKKYYEKSRTLHPDFDASQQEDKIFLTAYNNQAYQTLVDPLSRLKYIIETYTGPIQENHAELTQDFLMDMMDLHEQVNEAKQNADTKRLEVFKVDLQSLENKAREDSEDAINAFDNETYSDIIFNKLRVYYFKLKYFKRLSQAIEGGSIEL